jgi:hypothetical protein
MNTNDASDICEQFNRLFWHDSKLRSLRLLRNNDLDEVVLELELLGMPQQEHTPMTLVFEGAVFFFSDIDLQGKREASDDISSAKCGTKTELIQKLQAEQLKHSPGALEGYYHFSFRLVPPFGSIDVIASGFRFEDQVQQSALNEEDGRSLRQ